MNCNGNLSGGALVTTAAALAVALAQGRSADQLDLLALFFTSLADNLALFASQLPDCNEQGSTVAELGTAGAEV